MCVLGFESVEVGIGEKGEGEEGVGVEAGGGEERAERGRG